MANHSGRAGPKGQELHELSLQVLTLTAKAVLVTEGLADPETGRQINHWLPLSQIETDGGLEPGKVCIITIPQWLIEEKGLTVD